MPDDQDGEDKDASGRKEHLAAFTRWLVENAAFKAMQSYTARGRQYERMDADHLKARWIVLMQELAEDISSPGETEREDIESELRLRKDEPPYDRVKDEIEALERQVDRLSPEARKDPEARKRGQAFVHEMLDEFDDDLRTSKIEKKM